MSPRLLESISKQISFHFRSHQRVHHGVLRLNCHVFSCLGWVCDYVMYCDTFMQSTYSVANLKLPILELFSVSIAKLFTKYLTLGLCYIQANWLQESGSLLPVCNSNPQYKANFHLQLKLLPITDIVLGCVVQSHLSNKLEVTRTDFEKFHPAHENSTLHVY